jgi:creatinine amidohydrolase
LGCDHLIADGIARAASEATGVVVAPVLAYGMSQHLTAFPGTLSLAPATMALVLEDLFRSFYKHGFRRVLVVNGNGGNEPSLKSAGAAVEEELPGLRVKVSTWWTEPAILKMVDEEAGTQRGTHASTHETAFLMQVRPVAVKMERAAKRDAPLDASKELLTAKSFAEKYPDGVMGLDPSRATPGLGQKIFQKALELCVAELGRW